VDEAVLSPSAQTASSADHKPLAVHQGCGRNQGADADVLLARVSRAQYLRRTARPAGIVYWLDDAPLALTAAGLALQHTAIKSIYAPSFSNLNLP